MSRTSPAALDGIRVLEFAGSVGVAWAAKLFADLGADVVRVEGDDDLVRSRPHDLHCWLNTNKRSVRSAAGLIAGADLIIHDEQRSAALKFDPQRAQVVLALTPFGLDGPYADYLAEELSIIHGSSWGFLSPAAATDPDKPPLKAPGHHATITVATEAATVALAAVDRAQRTGVGEHIDFSSFAAAAKITEFAPAVVSFLEADASRLGGRTVVPWGIFECADGLMQIICPEQTQWEALVELMGKPEWTQLEVFADGPARSENADLVNTYLAEWFSTRQVDELYRRAQAAGVAMTPVSTMAQLEANTQFASRGFFATDPDGRKLPGPGFKFDQSWWQLRATAPELWHHEGDGWLTKRPSGSGSSTAQVSVATRPLDGLRICDFTWIWAGPACTQILAHLGADVVKLESPEHQCMFRRLPFNPPDLPLDADTGGAFQIYNSDKRSLGIDIAHPDSSEVVRRLVAASDVVIDNFGTGTMARLGYGVDDLRKINPEVIVVSLSGYGQTGPAATYMAYGPAGGSLAGLYAANGYGDGPVFETGVAIGDPGTGIMAAWATVAALAARRRTGHAARIDVAMVEAVASTVGELWLSYQSTGRSPQPIGNHDPLWSPHNCYPARGDDAWVTIACTDEGSWQSLVSVVGSDRLNEPRFSSREQRRANEIELDAIVAEWTSALDRWKVTRLLQAAGVAAFPALSPAELWNGDPQLDAVGILEHPEHPRTGARVVPGIPWRLTVGPNGLQRPAPLLGQHTHDVMVEILGFESAEVADLLDRGVIRKVAES